MNHEMPVPVEPMTWTNFSAVVVFALAMFILAFERPLSLSKTVCALSVCLRVPESSREPQRAPESSIEPQRTSESPRVSPGRCACGASQIQCRSMPSLIFLGSLV